MRLSGTLGGGGGGVVSGSQGFISQILGIVCPLGECNFSIPSGLMFWSLGGRVPPGRGLGVMSGRGGSDTMSGGSRDLEI